RATAHDGSGYASVWIGSGKRRPAPDVPKPNLYHAMGSLHLKQILSLTPAGAIGMPDREVQGGKFDRPGMIGMGPMDMGHMKGMDHSSPTSGKPAGGMDHAPGMSDRSKSSDAPMDHDAHSMKRMDDSGHVMETERPTARSGKKYGANFRPLAADVSSSKNLAIDGIDPSRPWPPYAKLRATNPTALSKEKPLREIRLTLDGDMERYVWFINNKPLSESDSIRIRDGEVVRFIMINRTMMHHPMHLHGHFFRVINGQGDYSPLKHTVDVAPMSTTVIEFDANEIGDWFFHCHLLYHMKSGMARVVHYEGFPLNSSLAAIRPNLYKETWYFWGQADVLSNMTDGFLTLSDTRNIINAQWKLGWQKVEDTEWEGILTWNRYFNRFLTLFAGVDLEGAGYKLAKARAVLGLRYLLPLHFESSLWLDSDSGARITLGKRFQLSPRLSLFGEAEYDTHHFWEGRAGLSYTLTKNVSLVGQWHSDYGMGGGVRIRF
ncbi:MAG: multicopper oxidase domain-containing protein, partial [Deltaproteobacteria bacterium]|nr:multicopper oxidase domain-containing protein [Deltaproteobacteria bacterium]